MAMSSRSHQPTGGRRSKVVKYSGTAVSLSQRSGVSSGQFRAAGRLPDRDARPRNRNRELERRTENGDAPLRWSRPRQPKLAPDPLEVVGGLAAQRAALGCVLQPL